MLRTLSCFHVNFDHLDEPLALKDIRSGRMRPAQAQLDYPWVLRMARGSLTTVLVVPFLNQCFVFQPCGRQGEKLLHVVF